LGLRLEFMQSCSKSRLESMGFSSIFQLFLGRGRGSGSPGPCVGNKPKLWQYPFLTEDIGRDQVPWWWWWWLLLSALCKSLVHFVMKIETYPYLTKIYNKREREREIKGGGCCCCCCWVVQSFVDLCYS
jgi:hypothetical protein